MADQFQSLYRRYRPQRFSEIRGQPHVVLALRNAVRDDRVAHAYLFSGPRGTGKTSTARILAKALNCADPQEGEPCDRCDSCLDIVRGASLDVHELDAASNNGVDAMRDLVARASLATPGKWKVYIVDEVHMLTTGAANALLKTLEEPPSHVVFVLATTDPQKVLPTIKSRTQHFEFHLLESDVLETLLEDVAKDAQLEIPREGIEAAVRRGHGSARDALSALDQVAAAGVIEDDERFVRNLIGSIVEQDTVAALRAVGEAMVAGFDAARLATELVEGLRAVFLGAVAPGVFRTIEAGGHRGELPRLGPARSVRALEVIGSAIIDMHESLDPRTTLEVALVRLTHPEVDESTAALLDRIERLERRLQDLQAGVATGLLSASPPVAPPAPPAPTPITSAPASSSGSPPALGAFRTQSVQGVAPAGPPGSQPPSPSPAPAPPPAPPPPRARPADPPRASASVPKDPEKPSPTRDDLVAAWGDHILARLRPKPRAVYAAGRFVAGGDGVAVFALPNSAHVEYAAPLVDEVAAALSSHFGSPLQLKLVTEAEYNFGPDHSPSTQTSQSPSGASTVGQPPVPPDQSAGPDPDESEYDEMETGEAAGPIDSVSWAESRLLEAFPGAEEITGDD